jgi:hypothetical protein
MLDTTNREVRRVKTPQGEGTLMAIDPDTNEYQVRISRKDATVPIEGPCVFKYFTGEELDEI